MPLAYALQHLEADGAIRLTNYGEYLAKHPPAHEVEILENTSWSCTHGLGRWSESCGCVTGEHPEWTQAWRAPLRAALDWLRDRLVDDPCTHHHDGPAILAGFLYNRRGS